MKRNLILIVLLAWMNFFPLSFLFGQSLPVGTPLLEDAYRRAQLLGDVDLSASFTSRPFFPYLNNSNGYTLNNPSIHESLSTSFKYNSTQPEDKKMLIKLLPFTWKQQINTDHPEGINDGAMIPARGYQTLISGGFFAKYGWVSIQFQPELVMAQNKEFQGFYDEQPNDVWKSYYNSFQSQTDIPENFGREPYQKAFWGQSSIRITKGPISLGLSNENLWWGSGMNNSLLMTNNAPGFKHLTLNTVKPIKTPIGSFEGQLISGRLESSGFSSFDSVRYAAHEITFAAKPNSWRYLSGIVVTYQPRWVPGLFLGAVRTFSTYRVDMGSDLYDYLPVITRMSKKAVGLLEDDTRKKDQIASVFLRLVAPKDHLEAYFEFGREDHSYDLTDFMLEPLHSAAYLIGARKLVPIASKSDEYLDLQIEVTQLAKRVRPDTRAGGSWYTHYQVVDGHTHKGQYLGAGIGTGGNMQSIQMSWVKNLKVLGVRFERIGYNEDFYNLAIKKYQAHWADIGGTVFGEWNYKNLLFNAKIATIGSINYQWYYDPIPSVPGSPPLNWDHGKIRYNVHAELGMTYCF